MPPCHIKLGLVENFVKSTDNNLDSFWYLISKFLEVNYAKVKQSMLIGSQTSKIIADSHAKDLISNARKNILLVFKSVLVGLEVINLLTM